MSELPDTLKAELERLVGQQHVLVDPDLRAGFETDWTGRFGGSTLAVVRPADPDELAAVVAACHRHGAPLVAQGGNTGLVGGGVPRNGEIVLSTRRLTATAPVDVANGLVRAQAGVTLADLQRHVASAGAFVALDMGSRDAATMGGIAATDAGGARAVRYGTARAQIRGLAAVLADGTPIRRMSGVLKDNAGLDWPSLLVGSEGTLALLTELLIAVRPPAPARVVALIGVADARAAVGLLEALRRNAPSLEACDFLTEEAMRAVLAYGRTGNPLAGSWPIYVLVELAAERDPTEELAAAIDASGVAGDIAVGDDSARRRALWELRERISDAAAAAGPVVKVDVGVPLAALPPFLDAVADVVGAAAPGARSLLFGHLGDGNVHVNVTGASEPEAVEHAVLELAAECGGTISAEHGVGVAKARWLPLVRSPGERAVMSSLKHALDPEGTLNPGVGGW